MGISVIIQSYCFKLNDISVITVRLFSPKRFSENYGVITTLMDREIIACYGPISYTLRKKKDERTFIFFKQTISDATTYFCQIKNNIILSSKI